jgi:hypothetical protein
MGLFERYWIWTLICIYQDSFAYKQWREKVLPLKLKIIISQNPDLSSLIDSVFYALSNYK